MLTLFLIWAISCLPLVVVALWSALTPDTFWQTRAAPIAVCYIVIEFAAFCVLGAWTCVRVVQYLLGE
jgi:hypothetical protein